jgi:hypothetical protein
LLFLAGLFFIQTQPSWTTSIGKDIIGNLLRFGFRRGLVTVKIFCPMRLFYECWARRLVKPHYGMLHFAKRMATTLPRTGFSFEQVCE